MKNLIDCTLRDGGYYTDWNFDNKFLEDIFEFHLTKSYLHFEIGYKNPFVLSPEKGLLQLTPENYIKDSYLKGKEWLSEKKVFVMFDAKSLHRYSIHNSIENYIDSLKPQGVWNSVRIATTYELFKTSLETSSILKKNGYFVAINLMQIHKIDIHNFLNTLESYAKLNISPDIIYFADSFGTATYKLILDTYNKIKTVLSELKIQIGFHAHNNRGLALSNSFYASDLGFQWIDGSWMGMGRGSGNAELEHLILSMTENSELPINKIQKELPISIFNHISSLKRKYNWGKSLEYDLASRLDIHPSFVSDIASEDFHTLNHQLTTLLAYSNLKHNPKINENSNINRVSNINSILTNQSNNKSCILVFRGDTSNNLKNEILKLRESKNIPIICANFDPKLIDFISPDLLISSSEIRIESYFISDYFKNDIPIIIPEQNIKLSRNIIDSNNIYLFKNSEKKNLTLEFALNILFNSEFKNIYLLGLDGSTKSNFRSQNENSKTLEILQDYSSKIAIKTFTFSQFNIKFKSIFELL